MEQQSTEGLLTLIKGWSLHLSPFKCSIEFESSHKFHNKNCYIMDVPQH